MCDGMCETYSVMTIRGVKASRPGKSTWTLGRGDE